MTIERKVGMGIAGQPSGGAANVADVFSTSLYTPATSNSNVPIVNGIDLAGEGGMVWMKQRDADRYPVIVDTEQGGNKVLHPHENYAGYTQSIVQSFNSNGFTTGTSSFVSVADEDTVAWTFRKKEKFFDVVTWTGNDVSGRTIAHGLDGPVGMIIAKRINSSQDWVVWNKDLASTKYLKLNSTAAEATSTAIWTSTAPTSTVFSVGDGAWVNGGGSSYVAYVFADNSSEDAEEQMIKCGIYTGNGTVGRTLDLGWEPQFILFKRTDSADNWFIFDTAREQTPGISAYIRANLRHEEGRGFYYIPPNPTGITFNAANGGAFNINNAKYMYMAIRAPMMVEPEAATDVFHVQVANNNSAPDITTGFPVDMGIYAQRSKAANDDTTVVDRIRGGFKRLVTNKSDTEATSSSSQEFEFDHSNKVVNNHLTVNSSAVHWLWKRAKGYMDCVAYSGNATAGRTVAHSLGVVPEMIWVRTRSSAELFAVYHTSEGATKYALFNTTAFDSFAGAWNNTAPTTTEFSVGNWGKVNANNVTYIAYLFATLAGISKVGSYTGNGSYQTINCGFSAGSRFILIKRTDSSADWYIWDTTRGIIAGNDPHLSLNSTAAEVTSNDSIDPANSGFIVNQVSATNINVSSGTYIFYAIA